MKKVFKAKFIVSLLTVVFLSSCSTAYRQNRMADLTDFLHLNVVGTSGGAEVHVGPILLGEQHTTGLTTDRGSRYLIGFGGIKEHSVGGTKRGVLVPLVRENTDNRGGYYLGPRYTSLGFEVAIGVGLGFEFDIQELGDFILGFFKVDFMEDDEMG